MSYVVPPAPQPAVPVADSGDSFPVRRIYCVGRNYAAHAREMGSDPTREPPFFFCKPADAIVPVAHGITRDVAYPPETANYHHEVELVVAIGKRGSDIEVANALEYVWGYAIGFDMTAVTCSSPCATRDDPGNWAKPSTSRRRFRRSFRQVAAVTRREAASGSRSMAR